MNHLKYDQYKDSQIYWVGNIPTHWDFIPVKHHFFSKKQVAGELSDNYGRLALTLNGVIKRSKEDAEGLQPEKFETYQIVRKDSLIFKLIDLENIKTSRVGLSKWDGLVSPAYIILTANGDILPEYAEKYFLNMWHEHIFNQLGSVGVRSNLNKEDVLNLPIIKPPLEEQKQIANYLNKKTSKIDTTIAKNKELITLLEEKRTALINQVVTKGLNPEVPMKDSGIEWIGEIPEHWDITNLKRFSNKITQGPNPDLSLISNENKYKILKTKDITDKEIKYNLADYMPSESYLKFSNFKLKNNDILICIVGHGSIGKINIYKKQYIDFIFTRAIGLLRPDLSLIEPYFVKYFFESKVGKELINSIIEGSTGQEVVKTSKLGSLNIPYPPLNEQRNMVIYLDKYITKIYTTIDKIKENIELLEEYKISFIHHVVTGKIDVRGEKV